MTNAKSALFKKLLTLLCTLSVATPCKPEYSFKNKREEEMYAAGFYGGTFLTCVVGYQLWKWNSSVVESRHKEVVAQFQRSLDIAAREKDAALKERDAARAEQGTIRQRLAVSQRMHAGIAAQYNNLKLVHSGMETCYTYLQKEHLELLQQNQPQRPHGGHYLRNAKFLQTPSAPQQEHGDIAPPAYPGTH